jgi:hypothetical protein
MLVSLSTLSNVQSVSPCPLFLLFVYKSVSCLYTDSTFSLPCIYCDGSSHARNSYCIRLALKPPRAVCQYVYIKGTCLPSFLFLFSLA